MKNYMVTHTFKSREAKAKMGEVVASMKMEDIVKSMTGETLTMFCWWKGTDPDAINKQLESMNDFFVPHQFTECTDDVMDYNAN